MTDGDTIRTTVRDSILSNVSGDLDADAVRGVEWAALEDTHAAIRFPPRSVNWETYRRVGR